MPAKHPLRFTNDNKHSTLPHGLTLYRLPHNAIIQSNDWLTVAVNPPTRGLMPISILSFYINKKVSKYPEFVFYRVAK